MIQYKDGQLRRIWEDHPMYLPLHYVLLFPSSKLDGWSYGIPLRLTNAEAQNAVDGVGPDLDPDDDNDEGGDTTRKQRKFMSQLEWYAYRLYKRVGESHHLFNAGAFFQQFLVDAWAVTDQARLDWLKRNQNKL